MIKKLLTKIDLIKWELALFVLLLSVITRLVVPVDPSNSNVFDEAYFVPQVESYAVNTYFFDIHPPLGKMLLYGGMMLVNPNAPTLVDATKVGNKVDNYQSNLNYDGIRLAPRILGTLVPLLLFFIAFELVNWKSKANQASTSVASQSRSLKERLKLFFSSQELLSVKSYGIPFIVGLMGAFENTYVLDSRFALLTQILLFFILLVVFTAIKYFKTVGQKQSRVMLLVLAITVGLAVSTKWLAAGVLPAVGLLIIAKTVRDLGLSDKRKLISTIYGSFLVIGLIAGAIYIATFAWHFGKITRYSPAADEVVQIFKDDLINGTSNADLWTKIKDWHVISVRYQELVPALDYGKPDEIGSHPLDWPIMARPFAYLSANTEDGRQKYLFLMGNPFVWALGLLGAITLTGLAIADILGLKLNQKRPLELKHWFLLILFFANWLPFFQISRVMYLYHYLPALALSMLIFGTILADFVNFGPRLRHILSYNLMLLAILIGVVLVFFLYSPLTYLWPVTKDFFEHLILRREWHVKWPGT